MDKKNYESNLVENINYKLSYDYEIEKPDKFITINSLKVEKIKDYIYKNYYVKSDDIDNIDKDKLLKDLVVFKAYKEDLEINIGNDSLIKDIITIFLSVLAIFVSIYSISQKTNSYDIIINTITNIPNTDLNKIISANNINNASFIENNKELLVQISLILIMILLFIVMWSFIIRGKKSDSERLKVVNYGIHTLEAIKEEKNLVKTKNQVRKDKGRKMWRRATNYGNNLPKGK